MTKYYFSFLFIIFLVKTVWAGHIVGGEIFYQWLEKDHYKITMDVYRDCVLTENAAFDSAKKSKFVGTITIFNGVEIYKIINLKKPEITTLELANNSCFEIPNKVCIERGRYTFEEDLPISDKSYHITYQRCCRNVTISNIISPVSVGTTFTVEISPEAQKRHISGPVFTNLPPIVICVNEQFHFDHSAFVDRDDIELRYAICSAYDGAGIKTGSKANDFREPFDLDGVAPNPDAPPPYKDASYSPPYEATNPLIGDPGLTIDSLTGEIFGIPTVIGQFVVTICASAYTKDGQFLTTIRREFQFNITDCKSLVYADIKEDENLAFKVYGINSCGEQTIQLKNESHERDFIKSIHWSFDIDGEHKKYSDWEPTIHFPDTGIYNGTLVLNPNTPCDDSAQIVVHIFPDIVADIDYAHDPCKDTPVKFIDQSKGEGGIETWHWNINNIFESNNQNTEFSFLAPGNKSIELAVQDKNGCTDTLIEDFLWTPVPEVLIISPFTFDGCSRKKIDFSLDAKPLSDTYDVNWDFGDGTFSSEFSPNHIYSIPGVYDIKVDVTSPSGCKVSQLFPNWVKIRPSPIADFDWNPEKLSSFMKTADFIDLSKDAQTWSWQFGDLGVDDIANPSFTFPDTGMYEIRQIVRHESGCRDTIYKLLDVEPIVKFFLPNAFSPNLDGNNDEFGAKGYFLSALSNYKMIIWNRWGDVVFESDNPFEKWNGLRQNTGKTCPQGIYTCSVIFSKPRGKKEHLNTFVTLLR